MKIRHIIIVVSLFLVFACKTREERSIDKLLNIYGKNASKSKSIIMIIPLDGCGSCIASSISFAKEYSKKENLYVVASTIEKKKIHMIFKDRDFNNSNFIADSKCISEEHYLVGTTTIIFFIDRGRIMRKVTVTDENNTSVFEDILKWN